MIPTTVGIAVLLVGVVMVYAGVHGIPGLLDTRPRGSFLLSQGSSGAVQ